MEPEETVACPESLTVLQSQKAEDVNEAVPAVPFVIKLN